MMNAKMSFFLDNNGNRKKKTSIMQTISHHHSASNFYISDGGCEFERSAPLFLQREAEDDEPQVRTQKKRAE